MKDGAQAIGERYWLEGHILNVFGPLPYLGLYDKISNRDIREAAHFLQNIRGWMKRGEVKNLGFGAVKKRNDVFAGTLSIIGDRQRRIEIFPAELRMIPGVNTRYVFLVEFKNGDEKVKAFLPSV